MLACFLITMFALLCVAVLGFVGYVIAKEDYDKDSNDEHLDAPP